MRSFNIDREAIGSDEIATFKDFKSIMRKHAQTTEDLEKIKPNSTLKTIGFSLLGAVALVSLFVIFSGGEEAPSVASTNTEVNESNIIELKESPEIVPVVKEYSWDNLIRTSNEDIENKIGVKSTSTDRLTFAKMDSEDKIEALIGSLDKAEIEFITNKLAFKLVSNEEFSVKYSQNLYKLGVNKQWELVAAQPVEMPFIEKPRLLKPGVEAVQMNFKNYDGPASDYENVFWSPVDGEDLAEEFYTTSWEDASVEKTSIDGVYKLKFKSGDKLMSFNGYPVLQKTDFDQAMKIYNSKLSKAQARLKKAPKNYLLQKGVYTVK